jgi:hypothetical protein
MDPKLVKRSVPSPAGRQEFNYGLAEFGSYMGVFVAIENYGVGSK